MTNKEFRDLEQQAAADEFVPDLSAPEKIAPPSAASLQLAGYVVMGVSVVCGLLAKKRGSHWLLAETETQDLHGAVAKVAEKYISVDFSNPLYALAATCGAIFVPRFAVEFMQNQQPENTKAAAENGEEPEHQMA